MVRAPHTITRVNLREFGLSDAQAERVGGWFPDAHVVAEHGWGLVATAVVQLRTPDGDVIVKAGGAGDHHIARELRCHREWLRPWTDIGRAPVLLHGDPDIKLLATRYLPGRLVLGDPSAAAADTFRQAGHLLSLLHGQSRRPDPGYEAAENARTRAWLAGPHALAPETVARLHDEIGSWPEPPAALVPTHGDWQPRNWIVAGGVVSVIDFGRAALRPAMSDFSRLAARDFRDDPELERAFLDGYGPDPREADAWRRTRVREAVGTACWAHQVGDAAFEAHGHRMIADVLGAS